MIEWSSPHARWLYLALAAGIVALILVARWMAISDRLRSWFLFIPRLAVFAILLVILLNPVLRREHRLPDQPGQVQMLIDTSRSMALEEPRSRAQQAQEVLRQLDQRLPEPDRPRVQMFRFGQRLSAATDLARLQPEDDETRLAAALEQLPARFAREPPKAVVVLSDGAVDDEEHLDEVSNTFRNLKVPIHVVPIGGTQIVGDVAIEDLVVPPRVEAGTKVPVRGSIRSVGFAGERLVLQIRAVDRPQLPPIATLPLTLTDRSQPFELVVETNADHGELVLEAPPLRGEVTDRNNRATFRLARSPRKLKVIYMEGTGGDEYRFLRDALQEDPEIECLAMVADQQYVQRPRLVRVGDNLRGFPATREELLRYDCVICSDISIGAFTREQQEWTVELVAKRGGGFAMIGGITSFGAGGWDQTAWDQLIPIDMAGGTIGRGWTYHQFGITVPEEAMSHPIWRIVEDPEQNRRVVAAIPQFLGTNYMQRLKPAATALAYSGTPIPPVGIMPVFAAQPYGRGRTFAFAPDTTADWGRFFESQWGEGDNRYFRRFWRNVVRWLTQNSTSGDKRLVVDSDRVIYRAGQPIELTATAYDEESRETLDYQLVAQVKALGASAPMATTPLTAGGANKTYFGQIDSQSLISSNGAAADAGVQATREVEVVATRQGKEIARASVTVQVIPDVHELLQPRARPEVLRRLAERTGGTVLPDAEALERLLRAVPKKKGDSVVTRQPVWDQAGWWTLIIALLTSEWILRRWLGYA